MAENISVWRFLGNSAWTAAHRRDETHIEHPVSLIQHPHPHVVEPHARPAPTNPKAAGGRDQNIGASGELANLRTDVDAATHHLAMQLESRAVAPNAHRRSALRAPE